MPVKNVTTSVDPQLHKRAVLNDVIWSEALALGISILSEDYFSEEKKLKKKIKEIEGELRAYKRQLKKLEEKRIAQKEAEKEAKELEKNSCDGCGEVLKKDEARIMPDKRRLCRNCFLV